MNLLAVVSTELLKLKRSRLGWVVVGVPLLLVFGLYGLTLGFQRGRIALPYPLFVTFILTLWSFFLLPFAVMLICLIASQVEHSAKAWNYVLAQPAPRAAIFGVKTAMVLCLVALMSLLIWGLIPLAGLARAYSASGMSGAYDWKKTFVSLAGVYAGALPLIAVQLWTALRFRGVAVPLAVGIGGGFFGIVVLIASQIIGATKGVMRFFPWLMPSETLRPEPWLASMVWWGLAGGAVMLVALVVHLSRREVA